MISRFPAETTVNKKLLPAETICVILLPAETRQEAKSHGSLGRKLNHTDSLCRKLFSKHNSLDRKQEIGNSPGTDSLCRKRKLAS